MLEYATLILVLTIFVVINGGVMLWAMSVLGSWRAPYVPLPHVSLPGIVKALRIEPGMVVYDIGCGDGRILRACNAEQKAATYKGVERAWYPYLLARLWGKKSNLIYKRGDAFAQRYADADRIVLYLLPKFVDRIAEKIAHDCKPGTRIVTVDFPITLWQPQEVIEQETLAHHMRGRMLYTYELKNTS